LCYHFNQIENVQEAQVNFSNGLLTLTHDLSQSTIVNEIEKLGYHTSFKDRDSKQSSTSTKLHTKKQKLFISGLFLILGFSLQFLTSWYLAANSSFLLTIFIQGTQVFRSAFYSLKAKSLDMNVLMTAAAMGAVLIGEFSEAALVVFLFSIGGFLQNRSLDQTRNSVNELINLAPNKANKIINGKIERVPVDTLAINDTIMIRSGERIPIDGEVISGYSSVNQAPITGESMPINKNSGDSVFAGTINQEGKLEINVLTTNNNTTISHMLNMIEEAESKKAPAEQFIDRFSKVYTPIVFSVALLTIFIPPLFFNAGWSSWFYRGLELLVVACPCALVISTPVAIVSSIGRSAKNGILFKGGEYLEKASKLTTVALDKTGTITTGKPEVTTVKIFHEEEKTNLELLLALESYTTHPISHAIVKYTENFELDNLSVNNYQTITGKGIQGVVNGTTYYVGSPDLFNKSIITEEQVSLLKELQSTGHTVVLLGTNTKIFAVLGIADQIRETSKDAIKKLNEQDIDTVMLTGDNQKTAEKIAEQAGVSEIKSDLMPEDKVAAIEELKERETVAAVGDGINDAPALTTADVGVAMGGIGTDTTIETADVVFMSDSLEQLPHTIDLSKRTLRIIKQNITFSLVTKIVAFMLIFPGWLTLWLAVLADSGAAILVILNSLRLTKTKS